MPIPVPHTTPKHRQPHAGYWPTLLVAVTGLALTAGCQPATTAQPPAASTAPPATSDLPPLEIVRRQYPCLAGTPWDIGRVGGTSGYLLVTLEPRGRSPIVLWRPTTAEPYSPTDHVSTGTLDDLGCTDGHSPRPTGTGRAGR
ncbi:hypothetical protein ACFYVL_08850 [Streptomyces sp. NPDC004111]|uniref:hypothetical protein n=1 Tax=Streptomyces sp. NPDC004111 TaxID=3364690 RepID=UPI0036BB1249